MDSLGERALVPPPPLLAGRVNRADAKGGGANIPAGLASTTGADRGSALLLVLSGPSIHIIQRFQTRKLFYCACRKCQVRRMEARACSIMIIELLLAVLDAPFPHLPIVFWL